VTTRVQVHQCSTHCYRKILPSNSKVLSPNRRYFLDKKTSWKPLSATFSNPTLANRIIRQFMPLINEPGLPLRRRLADDRRGVPVLHAQALSGIELVADKVGINLDRTTESAEEGAAGVVLEDEAAAFGNKEGLGCVVDLVCYDVAVVDVGGGVL
jgi:hypothetical protein